MNETPLSRAPALIQSLLFLGVLGVGMVSSLLRYDPAVGPIDEQRVKAPMPVFDRSAPFAFVEGYDKYFADNFGMRTALLRGYVLFRHFVVHADSADNVLLEAFGVED